MAPRNDSTKDSTVPRRSISPEEIQRIQGRVLTATGDVWHGPGRAPIPSGPAEETPRRMDYLPAWNVHRQPESGKASESGISFEILRAFSEQTIVRAAIETCKDDDETVEYVFALKPQTGENKSASARRAENDPRLKEVAAFFDSPDKRHDFATWRRLMWEEILACDNLSLYWWPFEFPKVSDELDGLVRNNRPPYALRIIDGDTIQPLIDGAGYEPTAPDPAYDQWIKGTPRKQFSSDLLLYAPFNPRVKKIYGFSPVEQLLFYIDIAIRRDHTKRAHYTDGNIPAGLWQAPETWSPSEIEKAQTWLDVYLSGNPKQRSKMIYMPGGKHPPIFPQDKVLQDPFDEWLASFAGWVFNVPVTSLLRQVNKATAETSKETATEGGRQARAAKMTRFLTRVVRWAFGPDYADIIVTTRQQIETDPKIQADIDNIGIMNGTLQIDEVREREGREPFGLPKGHMTAVGYMPFGAAPMQLGPDGQPVRQAAEEGQEGEQPAITPAVPTGGDPAQQSQTPGVREFNGAQVTSAKDIVIAVATGDLPRDAGVGLIQFFFGMSVQEAEQIMGTAGNPKIPTTPNPRPDLEARVEAEAAAAQQSAPPAPVADVDDESEKVAKAVGPFDFASTQVNLPLDLGASILQMGLKIPDDALAEKGRENRPHVTVKYGIHPDVPVDEVRKIIQAQPAGKMTFGPTAFFEAPDFDVLYVSVDSADLERINAAITAGVQTTATQSKYVPHATVAYLAKGRGSEFAGNTALDGVVLSFEAVQYSDVDGNLTAIILAPTPAEEAEKARRAALAKVDPKLSTIIRMTLRADDDTLKILASPFWQSSMELGAKNAARGSVIGIDSPTVRAFIAKKENKIVSVNETTGDAILARIAELQNDSVTPEKISDAIRDAFDLRDEQADLIARNEVGSSLNGGRFLQMREDKISQHEWMTTRDGRERETHAAIDGEIVEIGERFSNGLEYPQDPTGDPSEVIRCRCVSIPVVAEKSRNDRARQWRAAMRGSRPIERQMEAALHSYFQQQMARVLAAVADAQEIE